MSGSSEHEAPALLAISHGTSSPTGQAAVSALVEAVAAHAQQLEVHAGFVDVQQPDVASVLDALPAERASVVVPLLLSAGFHVHVDLAEDVATADTSTIAAALGPDSRLVTLLVRRLHEAGLRDDDMVVLGAAGASDGRAVADCVEMARLLGDALARPVTVGFLSAAHPRLASEVQTMRHAHPERRVVVANYLLAPGYFSDLACAAGADVTTQPLLTGSGAVAGELVAIVLERYHAAARQLVSSV